MGSTERHPVFHPEKNIPNFSDKKKGEKKEEKNRKKQVQQSSGERLGIRLYGIICGYAVKVAQIYEEAKNIEIKEF
jgi:hypothetical protein